MHKIIHKYHRISILLSLTHSQTTLIRDKATKQTNRKKVKRKNRRENDKS